MRLGAKATRSAAAGGEVTIELEEGRRWWATNCVVAIGRRPHTDDIGVDTVGLEPGEAIEVDDSCAHRRGRDWLYAIGDVNGRVLLTHMGKYQARIAADVIARQGRRARAGRARLAAGDLHRPAGGGRRAHPADARRTPDSNVRAVDAATSGNAGG